MGGDARAVEAAPSSDRFDRRVGRAERIRERGHVEAHGQQLRSVVAELPLAFVGIEQPQIEVVERMRTDFISLTLQRKELTTREQGQRKRLIDARRVHEVRRVHSVGAQHGCAFELVGIRIVEGEAHDRLRMRRAGFGQSRVAGVSTRRTAGARSGHAA